MRFVRPTSSPGFVHSFRSFRTPGGAQSRNRPVSAGEQSFLAKSWALACIPVSRAFSRILRNQTGEKEKEEPLHPPVKEAPGKWGATLSALKLGSSRDNLLRTAKALSAKHSPRSPSCSFCALDS